MRSLSTLALIGALATAVITPAFAPAYAAKKQSPIVVDQPWARATPGGARTGAVYMTLVNKADSSDRLIGASSPIAAKAQIHQMRVVHGIMEMHELAHGLVIPAKARVVLKPGAYHVMLIGLKKRLGKGAHLWLSLAFEKAGKLRVEVPVLAMGAMGPGATGAGAAKHQAKEKK